MRPTRPEESSVARSGWTISWPRSREGLEGRIGNSQIADSIAGETRELCRVDGYYMATRRELTRFRAREMETAGDGVVAAFDGPARAIRCARATSEALRELGIEIRVGVHTGEREVVGEKIGGIAIHIGARVVGRANVNGIIVSSTVKDLVAGSGIHFEDRGVHVLRGVPGEWRLFAVAAIAGG
jgi:class 3 adenylate cyclase